MSIHYKGLKFNSTLVSLIFYSGKTLEIKFNLVFNNCFREIPFEESSQNQRFFQYNKIELSSDDSISRIKIVFIFAAKQKLSGKDILILHLVTATNKQETFNMDCFYIKHESVLEQVTFDSVLWVKADGNYSIIYADGKEFILKTPLRRTLAQLPDEFFLQIHRSYFVAIKQIKQVNFVKNLITIDAQELPIGKSFRDNISARLHILK